MATTSRIVQSWTISRNHRRSKNGIRYWRWHFAWVYDTMARMIDLIRRSAFLFAAIVAGTALSSPAASQSKSETVAGDAKRGAYIARLGGCKSCHTDTKNRGPDLAGGVALKSPFGTFHVPNITPDKETGIGGWSTADFIQAMTDGRAPDGSHYFPSFPYTSYTRMKRQDLVDLKAYLDTVKPVKQQARDHEMQFPYNLRVMLGPWKWLFFRRGTYEPDPKKSAAWNRGAYIVTGPAHCGECHTARNFFGATGAEFALAGTRKGADGKPVPNITPHPKDGIGGWSESDVEFALKSGMMPDGDFLGSSMAEVIENSSSHWTESDLKAVTEYLRSLPKRKTP